MNITLKNVVTVVAGAAAVGIATVECIQVHREEKAKRAQIEIDMKLDLEAIRLASDVTHERLNSGEYLRRGLLGVVEDLDNEIKFQKIAIREKF